MFCNVGVGEVYIELMFGVNIGLKDWGIAYSSQKTKLSGHWNNAATILDLVGILLFPHILVERQLAFIWWYYIYLFITIPFRFILVIR